MFHGLAPIFSEICSRLQNIPVFFLLAYFQEIVGGYVLFKFKLPIYRKVFISMSAFVEISVFLSEEFSSFSMISKFFHHTKLEGSSFLLICWCQCSDTPGNCERYILLRQLPDICGERCTMYLSLMDKGGFMVVLCTCP